MKLRFWILLPLMVLSGCGLPPAIVIATYAADGVSYVSSGKSLTDHALSTVAGRDCALHRIMTENLLCRGDVLENVGSVAVASAADETDRFGVELAPRRLEPRWGPVLTASAAPGEATAATAEETYLVVASFSYWVNTQRFAEHHAILSPEVVPAMVDNEVVYRVVTVAGQEAVNEAGLAEAWPLRLCRDVERTLASCSTDYQEAVNIAALVR